MVGNKYKFAEFVSYDNMTHSRTYDLLAPEESNLGVENLGIVRYVFSSREILL